MAKTKATTKKAPKKKVDYRLTDSELEARNKASDRAWVESFLHKVMRGFIDFSILIKPMTKKYAEALLDTAQPIVLSAEDASVETSVSIEDIAYSRRGSVIRVKIRSDNMVTGNSSNDYELIIAPDTYGFISSNKKKRMVCEFMSDVIRKMYDMAEREFNKQLFEADKAPSAGFRFDCDD